MHTEQDGADDVTEMQELSRRVFDRTGYRSVGHIAWNLALYYDRPETCRTAVWRDGDRVVAWAWLERPDGLMAQVDPERPDLADAVLAWAEPQVTGPLRVDAADSETWLSKALRERGYTPDDGPWFSCMAHDLDDLPPVRVPDGYAIRPLHGPEEFEARAAVHRMAFTGSRLTTQRYANLTTIPPYRRETDLVAVAPDGTFAAYCLGWFDTATGVGELEPVGTHPDHRRRGLASAVCTAVLHAFRAAGGTRAVVNPRGDDGYPEPRRVYAGMGFGEFTRTRTWVQQNPAN